MLESIVSVLPSDWFSLSGWPSFSKCTVRHRVRIDTLNVILYYNLQRLVGYSGRWKKTWHLSRTYTKQLLDEVEHDIMNYQNRGLFYLPKPKAEADNTDTRF